jgi:sugar-specific transcriptional regulator TrmB
VGEESIEKVLKNFGLTATESELYIFLAKRGVLKSREIAGQMKKDRAQTLRLLKNLQGKGLVEATLEVPTRYAPVPFEQIIDLSIKLRKDEAALLEGTKNQLLDYWNKIGKTIPEVSPERFLVIKSHNKIYAKIAEMAKATRNQFFSISTIADLVLGMKFGLFEAIQQNPLITKVEFRFLTEMEKENTAAIKALLKETQKTKSNIKCRNPDLGLRLFPRVVIRDREEMLFFIKRKNGILEPDDLCLWTNCAELVQAFISVFEDLWLNATNIKIRISELEAGITASPTTYVISDAETARLKYNESILAAEKEIIMIVSPNEPIEILENKQLLNDWNKKHVSVKMMVPITKENLDATRELSKQHELRHIPIGYLTTTIIDGKNLFQIKTPSTQLDKSKHDFASTFYTNDSDYISRTRNMLNDIWKNASPPPKIALNSTMLSPELITPEAVNPLLRPSSPYQKMIVKVTGNTGSVTENDVLNKFINAKKTPAKNWPKRALKFYANAGHAVIHPPESFHLPDLLIRAVHENKQSSFGTTDRFYVYLWLKSQKDYSYVPVASVTDNPSDVEFQKVLLAGTPAQKNIQIFEKDALQLRIQGNTFFIGWTKPIPLVPLEYTLPPACILLESYGELRTTATEFTYPSGVKSNVEVNGYNAFVTLFHPASKYSGPGTDGLIGREVVATMHQT